MSASRLIPAAAALLLCALAVALGACGDDEPETSTVTETVTSSESSSASEETSTTGAAETTNEDGAPPAADITVDDSATFRSPSANIGCFIDRTAVRCDIAERDWSPPKAPASCEVDYGQGLTLSAGGSAELVCAGDTVLGPAQELAYGQSISAALLRCESSRAGISCRDVESGRGFEISREGYEIF